ncbi:hypothetical protein R6Q57_016005 [Mikania cordata]
MDKRTIMCHKHSHTEHGTWYENVYVFRAFLKSGTRGGVGSFGTHFGTRYDVSHVSGYCNNLFVSLFEVARVSAFSVGLVYGSLKLKYLKAKANSQRKAAAKAHH